MNPITIRYISLGIFLISFIHFLIKFILKSKAVIVTGNISRIKNKVRGNGSYYIPYADVVYEGVMTSDISCYSSKTYDKDKYNLEDEIELYRSSFFNHVKYFSLQNYYKNSFMLFAISVGAFAASFFV